MHHLKIIGITLFLLLHSQGLMANKLVSVALPYASPPYSDAATQSGIVVDILNQVLNKLDLTPKYHFLSARRLEAEMSNQRYDISFSMAFAPYKPNVYYSEKLLSFKNIAISLKGRIAPINSVLDLHGKSITSFQNSADVLGLEFKQIVGLSPKFIELDDQYNQLKLLLRKRIEVVIMEERIFNYYAQRLGKYINPNKVFEQHPIFKLNDSHCAFTSRALRNRFNKALSELKANKRYRDFLNHYAVF